MSADIPNQVRRVAPQHGPSLSAGQHDDHAPQVSAGRLSHHQAGVRPQAPVQPTETLASGAWSSLSLGITAADEQVNGDGRSEIGKAFDSLKSIFTMSVMALGICAAAALTFQFISVLTTIYESPPWLQMPALGVLAIVATALLWTASQCLRMYCQFTANQQISVRQWRELRARRSPDATTTRQHKVQRLRHWLHSLSFSSVYRQRLLRSGLGGSQVSELAAQREALRRTELGGCEANWLATFRDQFQRPLDSAATNVIYAQAKQAFWRAAVSPIPLLDGCLLLYSCFEMVTSICQIYQLRPSGFQSVTILSEAILSAYASANLDDASGTAGDTIGCGIEDALPVGADAAATVIGKVLGKVVATSAQGTLNAYFVYRIGMKTLQMVKPLAD